MTDQQPEWETCPLCRGLYIRPAPPPFRPDPLVVDRALLDRGPEPIKIANWVIVGAASWAAIAAIIIAWILR